MDPPGPEPGQGAQRVLQQTRLARFGGCGVSPASVVDSQHFVAPAWSAIP